MIQILLAPFSSNECASVFRYTSLLPLNLHRLSPVKCAPFGRQKSRMYFYGLLLFPNYM